MAAQPAGVIAEGKGHGAMPFSRGVQDADFGLMEVQMPQAMNMGHFKTAHLPALKALGGPLVTAGRLCRLMGLQPVVDQGARPEPYADSGRPLMVISFGISPFLFDKHML